MCIKRMADFRAIFPLILFWTSVSRLIFVQHAQQFEHLRETFISRMSQIFDLGRSFYFITKKSICDTFVILFNPSSTYNWMKNMNLINIFETYKIYQEMGCMYNCLSHDT